MSATFNFAAYRPAGSDTADATPQLSRCFAAVAAAGGGTLVIPPGDYTVIGASLVVIPSNTTVFAHGARFHLPPALGDQARLVLFAGCDVSNFSWYGGHFEGHCFDHRNPPNSWEPNANTRIFAISTSRGGHTANLRFRDLSSRRIAGAVVNVEGCKRDGSESEIDAFATDIHVQDCTLADSGKFMWDYGLLWQILVWPEDYAPADVAMAWKYFRQDLVRRPLRLRDGEDRVRFDNRHDRLPVTHGGHDQGTVCFFGDTLPANLRRGLLYHIVDSTPEGIRIAAAPGAAPIRFEGSAGPEVALIHNLSQAFYHLFAPTNAGPGKGCIDLVACRNTVVTGNQISALGDTMHIQCCHNNVFSANQITGSRMGAFFLAEYSRNSTITGNTVDGTNGSRVMSVEKSNTDTTIIGNTFRNGGRGSWINQPRNLIMQGNIFINNTTKCEPHPWRGRKTFLTADYERYAELYFTLHEPNGEYGPVILRDNLFVTGPECRHAIEFNRNGHDIIVDGNQFTGAVKTVSVDPSCQRVHFGTNPGMVAAE